jgi:hypothetical protein
LHPLESAAFSRRTRIAGCAPLVVRASADDWAGRRGEGAAVLSAALTDRVRKRNNTTHSTGCGNKPKIFTIIQG